MRTKPLVTRLAAVATVVVVAACQDGFRPTPPDGPAVHFTHAAVAEWFAQSAPEVMALPRTVFADHDERTNQLVFGIESESERSAVEGALARLGVPDGAYRIEVTEPIVPMSDNLRSRHRPTVGGIQIHFSMFLCTLGFNADHGGGRSFVTNSHCTDKQGENSGTVYYQPTSSVDPNAIGVEADDPAYFRGGECPRGRVCRFSDASRALYDSGTESSRGTIAKTTGENDGSLTVDGSFTVATQDNDNTTFSGTLNKVGRTTGWTSGTVSNTCVTVNVSGSNITLLCQTIVSNDIQIVAGGDSGSPVFRVTSGTDVDLVGILWGGNSSGTLFVFSPFKQIQDELGTMTATATGEAPPPDDGSGDGGGDDDGGGGNCPPGNPDHKNCQ